MKSTAVRAMLPLLLAGCGGGASVGPGSSLSAAPGPALTVERFLQSVNQNDWSTMSDLFGTSTQTLADRDGPERGQRHMQLLSSLLRHDDFRIQERRTVPGRPDAVQIIVEVVQGNERVIVPFTVVPRDSGGWIIEQIENLEELA